MSRLLTAAVLVWLASALIAAAPQSGNDVRAPRRIHPDKLFETSNGCLACHNGLMAESGEDVSIGSDWRATMMANSSRDPYWQASVRREVADHPRVREEIEDECSVCHMPMARTVSHASGKKGEVFAHLPVSGDADETARRAHDGVSCTVCHQIDAANFGSPSSFTGGYAIDLTAEAPRRIYGPFQTDEGRTTIMRSSSGFRPAESTHVKQSELCATCHTLYTTARGPNGETIGRLPEQMPYLEWKNSSYAATKSCQDCHMPVVAEDTPVSSVLGEPRRLARHSFRGGNSFMLRMLNRYRGELGVEAPAADLDRAALKTVQYLQTETAALGIARAGFEAGRVMVDVDVHNQTGHKLPTGYPARRVWLHLQVRNASGAIVFESGAVNARGAIAGNDGDADAARFEPHYAEITSADQVQIYESVMGDASNAPTTGLLRGVSFLKDNRLLPDGFAKATAPADVAVIGEAALDADFGGGQDRIRYSIAADAAAGPFTVQVDLRFQSIGYRWAENLKAYDAPEPKRFVRYYESMAQTASESLARASIQVSAGR